MSARLSDPASMRGKLQRAVLALLEEHEAHGELPTNGRFVFYELEQRGVVRKSRQGESRRGRAADLPREQDVTDALMWLHEEGLIPWSWIIDETRTLHEWDCAATVAECVAAQVKWARINPWGESPPLLLAESRSLGGVLRVLAAEYVCPIAATNGQVGGFLRTDIAPLLKDDDRQVLYLGDLDHQGGQIEANTRDVLVSLTGERPWTRIAITAEQVAERDLAPVWKKDHRYRPAREAEAWEAEALGQGTVTALVREALDARLPEPLTDVQERERAEQEIVARHLELLS